jgi:hypothetical protein
MSYNFTPEQKAEMLKSFGETFTESIPERIAEYAELWNLSDFSLIEYFNANCLFRCRSPIFGDCVLKIYGYQYDWYIGEIRMLRDFGGKCGYVRVYRYDETGGAILMERIEPGTVLTDEPNIERRIEVFAAVWQNAHMDGIDLSQYKTYMQICEDTAAWINADTDFPKYGGVTREMVSVCRDLFERYPERLLLSGDLWGDNLLQNSSGGYTIIDPHSKVGPKIIDMGRYITIECLDADDGNRESVTEYVIARLSDLTGLPETDIYKVFFIDMVHISRSVLRDGDENSDISGVLYAQSLIKRKWN